MPGVVAPAAAGADDGAGCGRTSRHNDDEPLGPVGGADGGAGAGVSRDDIVGVAAVDDAVKEGRRSPAEGLKLEPAGGADGGGAMIEPGVATAGGLEVVRLAAAESSSASESLFGDVLNQLLVAAIARLTA